MVATYDEIFCILQYDKIQKDKLNKEICRTGKSNVKIVKFAVSSLV